MPSLIETRVEAARRGDNPAVITRMASGWAVIGDVQTLPGYCLLLADPVVSGLNDLAEAERARYALDMIRIGDALMAVTGAVRINYEILANLEPHLHSHIIPRFRDEPDDKRTGAPFVVYDWGAGRRFDPKVDGPLMERLRAFLAG